VIIGDARLGGTIVLDTAHHQPAGRRRDEIIAADGFDCLHHVGGDVEVEVNVHMPPTVAAGVKQK
jgi:hypothetical protein